MIKKKGKRKNMENKEITEEEIKLSPETENDNSVISEAHESDTLEETQIVLGKENGENTPVNEIIELRDQNRKVFRMKDGRHQAVFYPEAVHFFDEKTNSFEEIDNTLSEDEDGMHISSGMNRFKARFNKDADSDELFSVDKDIYRISVGVKRSKKNLERRIVPRLQKLRVKDSPERKIKDSVVFEEAMHDADLEYSVNGCGVKENIIIRDRANVYRYQFALDCTNLTAEHDEVKQQISFCSSRTGEEVFCIPSPFMTDSNGCISTGVFYELKPVSPGMYNFTVTADSEWINA